MPAYKFSVLARAVPSYNGRRERIPRVLAWYQVVRDRFIECFPEFRTADRLEFAGKRARWKPPINLPPHVTATLTAHFALKGGRQPDLAQLTKALEDAIFSNDYNVTEHHMTLDRSAGQDRVDVEVCL